MFFKKEIRDNHRSFKKNLLILLMSDLRRSERIQKHQPTDSNSTETTPTKKKRKLNRQELETNFNSLNEDFVPTKLFTDLSFDGEDLDIAELAEEWLNTYEENSVSAQKEIVNFILNCCGSLITVEEHDISDPTKASEIVQELEMSFKNQGVFEFYLLNSKNNDKKAKLYKNLHKNFLSFFDELIINADEKSLIAAEIEDDDGFEHEEYQLSVNPLVFELLIWLSKFSSSHISAFRFTSTLAFYQIQTSINQLIPKRKSKAESLKKLIENEKNKKDSNKINAIAVKNWEELLQSELSYLSVLSTISEDALASCFVNRIRDTVPSIRSESIISLTKWIKLLPSEYYQSSYFKYYSWLLRDNDINVKAIVFKCLTEISEFVLNNKSNKKKPKTNILITPFHNFVNENLSFVLSSVYYENDLEIKIDTLQFVYSIIDTKWVSSDDLLSICSMMFNNMDKYSSLPTLTSKNKESRLLVILSKLFYKAESIENTTLKKKKSQSSIETFLKYFYKAFNTHLKITEVDCSYTDVHKQNVEFSIESISQYEQQIMQAIEFLSPVYEESLNALPQTIVDSSIIEKIDIDELSRLWNETNFKLILLKGYCNGSILSNKLTTEVIRDDVTTYLPSIFKQYIKAGVSSKNFSHLVDILTMFEYDDYAEETDVFEISEIFVNFFFSNGLTSYSDILMKQSLNKMMSYYQNSQFDTKIRENWERHFNVIMDKGLQYLKDVDTKNSLFDSSSFDGFIQDFYFIYMNKLSICLNHFDVELSSDFLTLFKKLVISNVVPMIDDIKTPNVLNLDIYSSLCFKKVMEINQLLLNETEEQTLQDIDWDLIVSKASNIESLIHEVLQKTAELQIIDYDSDVIRYLKANLSENLVDILISYYNIIDKIQNSNATIHLNGLDSFTIDENIFGAMREAFIFYESKVLNSDNRDDYEYIKLCTLSLKMKSLLLVKDISLETSSLWRRLLINKNRLGPEYISIIT